MRGVGQDSDGQPQGSGSFSHGTPNSPSGKFYLKSTQQAPWPSLAHQLVEGDVRSLGIIQEPPGGGSHCGQAYVHCREGRRLAVVDSGGVLASISPS